MKKERDEVEDKPLFEVWLAAYNYRLVQVAQGSSKAKAAVQEPSAEKEKPEPPSETKP